MPTSLNNALGLKMAKAIHGGIFLPYIFSGARGGPTCETEGAIAQLGERLNGIQEVAGSIPAGSTSLRTSCSKIFMSEWGP